MKKTTLILIAGMLSFAGYAQTFNADSAVRVLQFQKDSTLRALIHGDSAKVEKEYAKKIRIAKLQGLAVYPVLNAGENSGIIPVTNPTEIPDPSLDYKLLFDIWSSNPDSIAKEINLNLAEISRVINLHVASGIPLKKIFPVIIAHGPVLNALTNNEYYKEHFNMDNPNIRIINELSALGTKFIACVQAMAFQGLKKEALLPNVKVTLTAKTALSSYQLKGYVLYKE